MQAASVLHLCYGYDHCPGTHIAFMYNGLIISDQSYANDTRTRNRYRKPVPENLYRFAAGVSCESVSIFSGTEIWYGVEQCSEKLVPENWYGFSGTGLRFRFMVRVSLALNYYGLTISSCTVLLNQTLWH